MSKGIRHGRYIGARAEVRFCGALVRPDPRSRRHVLVQFDRERVEGVKTYETVLCHGWHRFLRRYFELHRLCGRSQSHERKVLREGCRRGGHCFDFYTLVCHRCEAKEAEFMDLLRRQPLRLLSGNPGGVAKLRETPRVGTIPGQERR